MNQVQDISNKIIQLIQDRPDKAILGVHLGYMLRRSFPDFSPNQYQSRNLRQFIRENVPSVREAGYSGADVRYALFPPSDPQIPLPVTESPAQSTPPSNSFSDVTPLPVNLYIWKAYSNPAHPSQVAVNAETGEVRKVASGSALSAPWRVIPKPSSEFLRDTAREFAATEAEPLNTKLTQLLADPKWYIHFSAEARKYGMATRWAAFRRKKLVGKYKAALRELNVQPGATIEPRAAVKHYPVQTRESDEEAFRTLMQRLIADLPISELRLLRLPVGVVFDALRNRD